MSLDSNGGADSFLHLDFQASIAQQGQACAGREGVLDFIRIVHFLVEGSEFS